MQTPGCTSSGSAAAAGSPPAVGRSCPVRSAAGAGPEREAGRTGWTGRGRNRGRSGRTGFFQLTTICPPELQNSPTTSHVTCPLVRLSARRSAEAVYDGQPGVWMLRRRCCRDDSSLCSSALPDKHSLWRTPRACRSTGGHDSLVQLHTAAQKQSLVAIMSQRYTSFLFKSSRSESRPGLT